MPSPWNEDRDWSTFYQESIDHTKAMQLFQYEQQALWIFLISHVSKEILHHIQLKMTFSDIDRNKDTYDDVFMGSIKEEYYTLNDESLPNLRNISTN